MFSLTGPAGVEPTALIADRSETLFITNYSNITNDRYDNVGTVFRLRPPGPGQTAWGEDVLYQFSESGFFDGRAPTALIESPQGILYGTAQYRGNQSCDMGCGTIFKLTSRNLGGSLLPWTKQDAYDFTSSGPSYPTELIKGTLPGGTFALFGIAGGGSVFEFVP